MCCKSDAFNCGSGDWRCDSVFKQKLGENKRGCRASEQGIWRIRATSLIRAPLVVFVRFCL